MPFREFSFSSYPCEYKANYPSLRKSLASCVDKVDGGYVSRPFVQQLVFGIFPTATVTQQIVVQK